MNISFMIVITFPFIKVHKIYKIIEPIVQPLEQTSFGPNETK